MEREQSETQNRGSATSIWQCLGRIPPRQDSLILSVPNSDCLLLESLPWFALWTPGVRELYRESIFVILGRVGGNKAGKSLARRVDEEQIAVRTIVPPQANVRARGLRIRRIHLKQRRQSQKT